MNYVEFVEYVENTLGWAPPDDGKTPVWKVKILEASKIKRRAVNDRLVTMPNLVYTVEYLRRKRATVKSPIGVCFHIEEALKARRRDEALPTDVDGAVAAALAAARAASDDHWVTRLTRASGPARAEVVADFWASQ